MRSRAAHCANVREVGRCQQNVSFCLSVVSDPDGEYGLVHGRRDSYEIDERCPPLHRGEERAVGCILSSAAREIVANQTGRAVQARRAEVLIAIPRRPAGSRHRRLDAEGSAHLARLEDSLRPIGEPHRLAARLEPGLMASQGICPPCCRESFSMAANAALRMRRSGSIAGLRPAPAMIGSIVECWTARWPQRGHKQNATIAAPHFATGRANATSSGTSPPTVRAMYCRPSCR